VAVSSNFFAGEVDNRLSGGLGPLGEFIGAAPGVVHVANHPVGLPNQPAVAAVDGKAGR